MSHVKIFRINKEIEMPFYAKEGDAAFDLRSAEDYVLKSGEQKTIKTGIKMVIKEGYVGLIWDRSGIANKYGIHALAGVIDSGYRGEVGIVLKNLSDKDFEITKNMRIAQMLIQQVERAKLEEVDDVEDSERGNKGFGSTGLE